MLLHKARSFARQQRKCIQERQAAILAAQEDWKATLAELDHHQHDEYGEDNHHDDAEARERLRALKQVLQGQVHKLNEDIRQLKQLKAQVCPVTHAGLIPAPCKVALFILSLGLISQVVLSLQHTCGC